MSVNLNDLAVLIARREGIKHQLTIAQIKEVMRITFEELAKMSDEERKSILDRYK